MFNRFYVVADATRTIFGIAQLILLHSFLVLLVAVVLVLSVVGHEF